MIKQNFKYNVTKLSVNEWNKIIDSFSDANIYQTIEFTKHSKGGENYEHFIVKENDSIVSAVIVRLKIIPIIERGIAYIRFGPMWQLKSAEKSPSILETTLQLLYEEYAVKRKLVLRIVSNLTLERDQELIKIHHKIGFKEIGEKSKSIYLDLTQSEQTIREKFRKKWRYRLKQAEKKNLEVIVGSDEKLYNDFLTLYNAMHKRKKFKEFVDVKEFKKINSELTSDKKFAILICRKDNVLLSAMIISTIGNTGIYLLGGSSKEGLKASASYLLQWKTITLLKEKNIKIYDLGGIDKKENPGVFTFKSGLGGEIITHISALEIYKSKLSKFIISVAEKIK